jgi:hypothetical protein
MVLGVGCCERGVGGLKRLLIALVLLAALLAGVAFGLRTPVAETTAAALKAYPVYAVVRTESETRFRGDRNGSVAAGGLRHGSRLSGPRDRWVTTPNNDTLYSTAFIDLSAGPVELDIPALPDRYHSVAVMDARTDNWLILGTRDDYRLGARTVRIAFGDGALGQSPPVGPGAVATYRSPTRTVWLLVRVLVEGPDDLQAARAAQRQFVLRQAARDTQPSEAVPLPAVPDPAALLRVANPVISANPRLQDPTLAATGFGGAADAFDTLPAWRQWLWRLLLPRLFERIRDEVAAGPRNSADGWSRTPPGIGTAEASDGLRAAVALVGLGALPAEEAVYWSAVLDSDGAELVGGVRYQLKVPADVPVRAFWSLSLYERLPDGRLFYVDNPIDRYAVGNRTPGLVADPDGGLTLTLSSTDPGPGANWLPTPAKGPITVTFRAYLPEAPILSETWRLPAIRKAEQ